ncbi:exportin-T-like [Artemia franciscana]
MNQNILKLLETPLVPDAQAKVLSYFEEVKGSDTGWQLAITELTRTADNLSDHTKFFWWQIVENFVKTRYTQMDSASLLMRNFLFQWLHNMSISAKEESSFLRNKAAQVFSLVFIVDFPRRWQSFLVDFLQTLKLGPKAVDFYLRVLKAIDSEVVDREIPHSKEEADRNTLIKDTIRETCINDLVNSWYQICVLYEMSDSKLVSECLDVIGAYISWIDISLIANERFVTLFIRFMKDQHLREPDCDCLCEVVAKGMDSSAKVKLIESLYSLLHGAGVFVIDNEEDSDYLCKLGKLINTMGVQLAVSWTR